MTTINNVFTSLPEHQNKEIIETLLEMGPSNTGHNQLKIERIISNGECSADGYWYQQQQDEWVIVLNGHGVLEFESGETVTLGKGDYCFIKSGLKHRVAKTSQTETTLWLAVHYFSDNNSAAEKSSHHCHIESISLEQAAHLLSNIPELAAEPKIDAEYLRNRIGNESFLALAAYVDEQPVAVKVGYQLNQNVFYSWLGGVDPEYRKLGLAQSLLSYQETWVEQQGYKQLRVKSMNIYPMMMQFLLKNGYKISGYQGNSGLDDAKIMFHKSFQ
ncbi:GNAT family N-acetyltransferase [Thalassotalea sp. HSM 43]|uniref:GNAT family N-acetyltransferase n=1 Tax=Thalassotalea sp. HSM 43 TaxID=2552945 RepID=UPI00167B75EE|nr:GNAT family N-acetyltransferase [Thalassotalea sp. HSM 43]